MINGEQDFPPGHPARFDFDAASPDAKAWRDAHFAPKGERDFPRGHVKASDSPKNDCSIEWRQGIDPARPELEAFSGRTPEQVAAMRELYQEQVASVKESPALEPIMAINPAKDANTARATKSGNDRVAIFCPGCEELHVMDSRWTFNGSFELPTFAPSVLWNGDDPLRRCHSFISNGQIAFLNDCAHSLKGQTVALPPVSNAYTPRGSSI